MLAARCRDGSPATPADFVAALRPSAVTDTAAMATAATDSSWPPAGAYPSTITATITASSSSTATSSSATSSTRAAATAFRQRGAYRQCRDCENEHEHSESFHVAPPPWNYLDYPSIIGVSLLTHTQRQSLHSQHRSCPRPKFL
jgi:hypothetical protein